MRGSSQLSSGSSQLSCARAFLCVSTLKRGTTALKVPQDVVAPSLRARDTTAALDFKCGRTMLDVSLTNLVVGNEVI